MIKVLYILPNAYWGGAEKLTELLITNHKNFTPVVAFFRDGPLVEHFKSKNIKTYLLTPVRLREIWKYFKIWIEIYNIIKVEDIKIAHSCMSYAHFFSWLPARVARVRIVWFQHGPITKFDFFFSKLKAHAVFTQIGIFNLQRKITPSAIPLIVINPGVNVLVPTHEEQAKMRGNTRGRWGVAEENIVFGFIARFEPGKGQKEFILNFAELLKCRSNVKAVFVGSDQMGNSIYKQEIKKIVKELKIDPSVIFDGFQNKLEEIYCGLDVLVQGSIYAEAFSLVVTEGMSFSLPVVASPAGGPAFIIENEKNGFLVHPFKKLEVQNIFLKLADNKALRKLLGDHASSYAKKRYNNSQYISSIERCYKNLV